MNSDPIYDASVRSAHTEGATSTPYDPPIVETFDSREGPVKRVALASIGAIAEACDTAEERFERLVDRGERVQQEWKGKADDVRLQNAGARGRVREYFRTAMDVFFDTLNVPSKTDVDTINVKLSILTRKLDDLQTAETRGTSSHATGSQMGTPQGPSTGDLAT